MYSVEDQNIFTNSPERRIKLFICLVDCLLKTFIREEAGVECVPTHGSPGHPLSGELGAEPEEQPTSLLTVLAVQRGRWEIGVKDKEFPRFWRKILFYLFFFTRKLAYIHWLDSKKIPILLFLPLLWIFFFLF